MITATRRFTFSSGHRLKDHAGWCKNIHGHNYVAEVTVARKENVEGDVDDAGMVVDFGFLKRIVGDWIGNNWDHSLILDADDPLCERLADFPIYHMPGPPTAENMASHLFYDILPQRFQPPSIYADKVQEVEVVRVVLWENENSKAVVE